MSYVSGIHVSEFGSRLYFVSTLQEGNGTVGYRVLAKLPAMPKFLAEVEAAGLLDTFWLKQIEPRATKTSPYKASIAVLILNAIVANVKDPSKLPKVI